MDKQIKKKKWTVKQSLRMGELRFLSFLLAINLFLQTGGLSSKSTEKRSQLPRSKEVYSRSSFRKQVRLNQAERFIWMQSKVELSSEWWRKAVPC